MARSKTLLPVEQFQKGSILFIMSKRRIKALEKRFPKSSSKAFAAARGKVLAAGNSVLQAEQGQIIRVYPDGRSEVIKAITPPVRVTAGSKFVIASR